MRFILLVLAVIIFFPTFFILNYYFNNPFGYSFLRYEIGLISVFLGSFFVSSIFISLSFKSRWLILTTAVFMLLSISFDVYTQVSHRRAVEGKYKEKLEQIKKEFTIYQATYLPEGLEGSNRPDVGVESLVFYHYSYKCHPTKTPDVLDCQGSINVEEGPLPEANLKPITCYSDLPRYSHFEWACKDSEGIEILGRKGIVNGRYIFVTFENSYLLIEFDKNIPRKEVFKFAESFRPIN